MYLNIPYTLYVDDIIFSQGFNAAQIARDFKQLYIFNG